MSSDGNEWELSKENVQPLRQGRVMSTLQEALAQQDVSSHTAIQEQKRYIKWTEQTFPQGGKDSNLSAVLERAVKALNEQQRYYQDPRYLSLWIKFGNCCTEPLDLYSYLHSQKIGTSLAQLYITWAEALETRGNFKKADLIFQDGLLCKAEPLDKLLSHHRQFQARVYRQTLQDLEEDGDVEEEIDLPGTESQRTTLAELKGRGKKTVRAPINRVGNALKVPSQGQRLLNPGPRQASNRLNFAVFDENKVPTSRTELPALVPQPWVAPPTIKAKENELQAGPWNVGGRRPQTSVVSNALASAVVPSFTPYVEESAQQHTMTPCKIEPSINSVLSARKPGKDEDPLQRVQSHQQDNQEKKEQFMYCKEKVYAGVEEFSLEEIRAEIYRKKARRRQEEELQTIAQKKAELQRKIEEIERQANREQRSCAELSQQTEQGPIRVFPDAVEVLKPPITQSLLSPKDNAASAERSLSDSFSLASNFEQDENFQRKSSSCSDSEIPAVIKPSTPFSIFDESVASENECVSLPTGLPLVRGRLPLCVRKPSESSAAKENMPPEHSDDLHGVELLSEDAIVTDSYTLVTGSYKNHTLCPTPEDTCDFVRAAHMVSTPFHGVMEQRSQLDGKPKEEYPESKTTSLNQQTVANEDQYAAALCVKKLSPIMEASQEDTVSSASSGSPSQICIMKFQTIPEVLVESCTDETTSDTEHVFFSAPEGLWNTEQQKQLLSPLPDLLTQSPDFKQEAQPMPWIEVEKEVNLGYDTYYITCEYLINEDNKMFSAVEAGVAETSKAFLIKVHSEPVPWDFYITLQLRERLAAAFDQSFSENCTCFLYHNGCVTLHKEINCFTLQDLIQQCKNIPQEVIMLTVDHLLEIVEKMHKAEIIHGNLQPGTLLLGDRISDPFAIAETTHALKVVDFSHSLDLTLHPNVNPLKSFPIAQTKSGQQLLDKKSPPYQVDLIGIADMVHLMLCGEHMEVHQEEGCWKIDRDLSQSVDSEMWSKFFGIILNASGKSTVTLLGQLREELSGAFDSTFPDRLCESLLNLEGIFNTKNIY